MTTPTGRRIARPRLGDPALDQAVLDLVDAAAIEHDRDLVIEMVASVLRACGSSALPVRTVHASRGKATRAEPVAVLYEQGRVSHVGSLAALEDQMTAWDPSGDGESPDRVDALVYALTELMPSTRDAPTPRPTITRTERTAGW